MSSRVLDTLTLVAAMSALVLCATSVHERIQQKRASEHRDRRIDNWGALARAGHRIGSPDAPVQIVTFVDYECPVCQGFHNILKRALAVYGSSISVVSRHFPLAYHSFSYPAARAAECAGRQDHFFEYHDALLSNSELLGLWDSAAVVAGVPDMKAFTSCAADTVRVAAIESDLQVVNQLEPLGTPTILINGWLLGTTPDSARLDGLISGFLKQHRN